MVEDGREGCRSHTHTQHTQATIACLVGSASLVLSSLVWSCLCLFSFGVLFLLDLFPTLCGSRKHVTHHAEREGAGKYGWVGTTTTTTRAA